MGLRPPHYSHVLDKRPRIDWLEIISENYMDTDGLPKRMLEKILTHYPIVMHGVSLSIGTIDPINSEYLAKLKKLIELVKPAWVSDHLCWTGVAHKNTHDLLPVPYTEEALVHIIERIKRVQDVLERPLVLENPSTYLEFSNSTIPEWEFIARMSEGADCALLLDVNNVYVSCYNHHWDPQKYIEALPLDRVAQIHLAGHDNKGTHIIDTHDDRVIEEVWNLYAFTINRAKRQINTMVEWDDNIPDFPVLLEEVNKARQWGQRNQETLRLPAFKAFEGDKSASEIPITDYAQTLSTLQKTILENTQTLKEFVLSKPNMSASEQLGIYIKGYRYRLFDIVHDDYPALEKHLGKEALSDLIDAYIEETSSSHFNISRYVSMFPQFVLKHCDEFAYELSLLETQVSQLYDAEETHPLTVRDIEGVTPETLMESTLYVRKALSLHQFSWNVNKYFNEVMAETPVTEPEQKPSYLAIYRHEDQMWRLDLEEQEHRLLLELISGLSVSDAIGAALSPDGPDEQLAERLSIWFGRWINNGLLAAPTR